MKKPNLLWSGIAASAALLAFLILVRSQWPDLLDISSAWLGIAVLPIIVGLLAGGYIRAFKGFGIEVEAALAESVTADLTAESARDYDPFAEAEEHAGDLADAEVVLSKASLGRLDRLTSAEKASFERLSFRQGYSGYRSSAVEEHLRELPNVTWIEIDDDSGGFLGAINRGDLDLGELDKFVEALLAGTVLDLFPSILASDSVDQETPLREVAREFKMKNKSALPVIHGGRLIGVVERDRVHQKIGEAFVRTLP